MRNALNQDRKAIQICLHPDNESAKALKETSKSYRNACNEMYAYAFVREIPDSTDSD